MSAVAFFRAVRYLGLGIAIFWIAGAFLLSDSDLGRFLASTSGMMVGLAGVALNVVGLLGLLAIKHFQSRP